MKIFKNKKGSQLVEKILMAAFAVAGGGAVIVYGSNVLTNAKNTEITGILGGSGQMSQAELDAHFDDDNYIIHLTQQELNSKSFSNLCNFVYDLELNKIFTGLNHSTITAENKTFEYDECIFGNGTDNYIFYWGNGYSVCIGDCFDDENHIRHNGVVIARRTEDDNDWIKTNFTTDLTWNTNCEEFYQEVKAALISDLS